MGLRNIVAFCIMGLMVVPGLAEVEFSGSYAPSGELRVGFAIETHFVRSDTAAGKAEIKHLKEEGFTCVTQPRSLMKCRKFTDKQPSVKLQDRLRNEFRDSFLEFGQVTAGRELVRKGVDSQDWLVHQEILVDGVAYKSFVLREMGSLSKIIVGSKREFILSENGQSFEIMIRAEERPTDFLLGLELAPLSK